LEQPQVAMWNSQEMPMSGVVALPSRTALVTCVMAERVYGPRGTAMTDGFRPGLVRGNSQYLQRAETRNERFDCASVISRAHSLTEWDAGRRISN
jgi:hypothetical protein